MVQAMFAFDRIRHLAPQQLDWKTREPFASVLRGDEESALAGGEQALVEIAMASHAGTTTEDFARFVGAWIASARHTLGSPVVVAEAAPSGSVSPKCPRKWIRRRVLQSRPRW
jgi:hypothetical protein